MSKGRFHDKANLFTGAILTGILVGLERSWFIVIPFVAGYLLATLIFSPDTDVMPKKRTALLQFVLYPYSILFKHRGLSHSILFGTLLRFIYGLVIFGIMIFVLGKMGYIEYQGEDYLKFLKNYIQNWDFNILSYKMVTWLFIGMFMADIHHYFVDGISSFWKKLKRILFGWLG